MESIADDPAVGLIFRKPSYSHRAQLRFTPCPCYRPCDMEKKLFDEVVLLIMSFAFSYFGLSLSFAPRQYKAFAATVDQSFSRALARAPVWVIRSLGILLISVGLLFFYKLIAKWP